MRTRQVVLLLSAATAAFLACHQAPTAPIAVALQLDRDTYVAVPVDTLGQYAFRLVVQYQNGTSAPIYLRMCRPGDSTPVFEVTTTGGTSGSAYEAVWACTGASPLEFLPGARRTDSLLIQGPTQYDGITHEPLGVLTGSFRLEYETLRCADDAPTCAQSGPRVASAPFVVRLP